MQFRNSPEPRVVYLLKLTNQLHLGLPNEAAPRREPWALPWSVRRRTYTPDARRPAGRLGEMERPGAGLGAVPDLSRRTINVTPTKPKDVQHRSASGTPSSSSSGGAGFMEQLMEYFACAAPRSKMAYEACFSPRAQIMGCPACTAKRAVAVKEWAPAVRFMAQTTGWIDEEGAKVLALRESPMTYQALRVSGMAWRDVGTVAPEGGSELAHVQLAEALAKKTEFTEKEWKAFNITTLRADHFIKSGDSYFQPTADDATPDDPLKASHGDEGKPKPSSSRRLAWAMEEEPAVDEESQHFDDVKARWSERSGNGWIPSFFSRSRPLMGSYPRSNSNLSYCDGDSELEVGEEGVVPSVPEPPSRRCQIPVEAQQTWLKARLESFPSHFGIRPDSPYPVSDATSLDVSEATGGKSDEAPRQRRLTLGLRARSIFKRFRRQKTRSTTLTDIRVAGAPKKLGDEFANLFDSSMSLQSRGDEADDATRSSEGSHSGDECPPLRAPTPPPRKRRPKADRPRLPESSDRLESSEVVPPARRRWARLRAMVLRGSFRAKKARASAKEEALARRMRAV